jgi:uncharacterized protein (DUF488 family)
LIGLGAGSDGAAPALCTAGYEGLVQEQLFDRLEAAGVRVLIDIRAVANSRKAGFSKTVLGASAEARGLRYMHVRALGTPKAGRQAARAGRGAEMAAIFGAHLATPAAQAGLAAARDVARAEPSCLLCFERDFHLCHRTIVAAAISAQTGQPVVHL